MGGLKLSERCSYIPEEADCMLTACQDHLRRHLADNIANDEECREEVIVGSSEVQVFLHAGDVCIRYHQG